MCRMAFQRAESGTSSAMEKSLTWLKASHGKRNIVCLRTFLFYEILLISLLNYDMGDGKEKKKLYTKE